MSQVAFYKLDETTGTVAIDLSASGNDGTYTNGTASGLDVAGLAPNSGRAKSFSGTAFIDLGNTLDFTGDFSAMAFLDIDPTETIGGIVSRWHSSQGWLVLAINGKIRVYRDGSFIESTSNFPSDPFHLAVTAEGTAGKIYFDKVEDVSGTFSSATHTLAAGTDAQIASYTNSASAGVNLLGTIDEVDVRDDALTPAAIAAAYDAYFATGSKLTTPPLPQSVTRRVSRAVDTSYKQ